MSEELTREELETKLKELENWRDLFLLLAARALTPERMAFVFDPDEPDLAIVIDTLIEDRDGLNSKLEAIEETLGTGGAEEKIAGILDREPIVSMAIHDSHVIDAVAEALPGQAGDLLSQGELVEWLHKFARQVRET